VVVKPDGLLYRDDLVTPEEEQDLIEVIEGLDFRELTMRGQTAKRTVRHFGLDYEYVLSGKARWSWQHSIPATKDLRYSVTFRTLKRR
jgi:hypothetical protein